PLVELVHVRDGLVVEGGDAGRVLVRRDELVLRVRDLRVDAARHEALRVALELLEARLRQPDLVGLVVDREVRPVAEALRLAAQDAPAGGVEGEDPDRARRAAEEALEPRAHLARRLVRERDGEDLLGLHAARRDQVRDAMRQHPRLAGAGAGDDEQRPLRREHGFTLRRVEALQVAVGADDGHRSRCYPGAAARPGGGTAGRAAQADVGSERRTAARERSKARRPNSARPTAAAIAVPSVANTGATRLTAEACVPETPAMARAPIAAPW